MSSRVPQDLRAGIAALLILLGSGGAGLAVNEARTEALQQHEYVLAVAADETTSRAVKIAMVMGSYYESSYRHIGTPYVDKLGKGQPLTVCNGVTGPEVTPGRWYAPQDCYHLERSRYRAVERWLVRDVPGWGELPLFVRATMIDFVWNKGAGAFSTSTMRRLLLAGDLEGACAQNPRWNRGTVNGVSTVLPGLDLRGKSNGEICLWDAPPPPPRPPEPVVLTPELPPAPAPTMPPPPWWRRLFARSAL